MAELQLGRDQPDRFENLDALAKNEYPSSLAAIGLSALGDKAIQAYAIMGQSTGSRTRIFVDEGLGAVRTIAPGKTQEEMAATENAELIYYQASLASEGVFVISNGAQTTHVYESILDGSDLDNAIKTAPIVNGVDLAKYEPDAPNFTPRITGVIDLRKDAPTPFGLAVVRKKPNGRKPVYETHVTNDIQNLPAGTGVAVQTYLKNGDPLPSFDREPYTLPFDENATKTALRLWSVLNRDNRVAIMTRSIDLQTQKIDETCIINALAQ